MESVPDLMQPFYGYLHLEMYAEANDELENLPNEAKAHPLVLLGRLELLMEMARWEDGVILGQSLCELWPDEYEFWFKAAYCLHEDKRTAEAKATLIRAPAAIRDTALYCYNLACYETQLGNLGEAKTLLKQCFQKDKRLREGALDDPDLEPLWDSFGEK
jgi:tetratricopeptide (TPR) repeat protein